MNKKICKRCKNKFTNTLSEYHPERWYWRWSDKSEDDWNKWKIVVCPYDKEFRIHKVYLEKGPKDSCPYLLEHVVNA